MQDTTAHLTCHSGSGLETLEVTPEPMLAAPSAIGHSKVYEYPAEAHINLAMADGAGGSQHGLWSDLQSLQAAAAVAVVMCDVALINEHHS
jgi:hypothetical protein